MTRRGWTIALAIALGCAAASPARGGPADAERGKAMRDAFKPLRLPAAAKFEKEVAGTLPAGVVIEAGPFTALIERFGRPHEEALDRREAALRAVAGTITQAEADAVKAAWKAVESECGELAERVADVEARYAEVYNLEWTVSGEKERQTRKLAAVLIPLYRRLLLREAAIASQAGEVLGSMKEGAGLAWLVALASDPAPGLRWIALDALSRAGGAEAAAAIRKALASDPESPLRLRALGALGRWNVSDMQDAVVAALSDRAWEVRALAVAMCVRARLVGAAPALVEALAKEDGRLRQDIDDALFALWGVRMYGDTEAWRKWLVANREEIERKASALAAEGAFGKPLGPPEEWEESSEASEPDAGKKEGEGTTAAFYGITTLSKRILFVVDISKSMEDEAKERPPAQGGSKDPYAEPKGRAKVQIAKWQMHRAVAALPPDARFNLVVYSESYRVWQPEMAEASAKAKAQAHEFIDGIAPNGTTNIADSVDRAFELAGAVPPLVRTKTPRASLAADTVYLLSDGNPNRGRLADLNALLDEVVRRNRTGRLVFHTVGIGEVAGSEFLKSLARLTGGQYVGFP